MKTQREYKEESPHYEFSVRAHLIRWFHERSTAELKAMQKAHMDYLGNRPIQPTGKEDR